MPDEILTGRPRQLGEGMSKSNTRARYGWAMVDNKHTGNQEAGGVYESMERGHLMHIINAMPGITLLGNQRDFGHTIQFDLTAWDDLNATT